MRTRQDLIRTFEYLLNECIHLKIDFDTFQALYANGLDDREILHRCAGRFFNDLHRILVHNFYLSAFRIGDRKSTVSIHAMNGLLRERSLLNERINLHSRGIIKYHSIINKARNKLIAHIEYDVVESGSAVSVHREEQVVDFIRDVQSYTNEVAMAIGVDAVDYEDVRGRGDVHDFLKVLRRADAAGLFRLRPADV